MILIKIKLLKVVLNIHKPKPSIHDKKCNRILVHGDDNTKMYEWKRTFLYLWISTFIWFLYKSPFLYCLGYWLLQLYEPSYSYVFVLLLMDYMCILKYCKKRQHRSWYVDKSSGIPALQKATCHTLYFVTRVFIYMYILYK